MFILFTIVWKNVCGFSIYFCFSIGNDKSTFGDEIKTGKKCKNICFVILLLQQQKQQKTKAATYSSSSATTRFEYRAGGHFEGLFSIQRVRFSEVVL